MTAVRDLVGFRSGRLVAIARDATRQGRNAYWLCRCDCGADRSVSRSNLTHFSVRSCGCLNRETRALRHAVADPPDIPGEEWRPVAGATRYSVSDCGRVKGEFGEMKRGHIDKNGYPMVHILRDDGRSGGRWVHKLVAEAFLGPCPSGKECDHKDRDRTNPRLTNLHYVTHQQNIDNSAGTPGEAHGLAKLTEAEVREILALPPAPRWGRRGKGNHPNSVISIAERYGISDVTVLQIRRGERWRHVFDDMLPRHPHLAELAKKRRCEPPGPRKSAPKSRRAADAHG